MAHPLLKAPLCPGLNAPPFLSDETGRPAPLAGIAPDAVTYSTLMELYARQGKLQRVVELFRRMRREDIAPDPVVYSSFIRTQGAGGTGGAGSGGGGAALSNPSPPPHTPQSTSPPSRRMAEGFGSPSFTDRSSRAA